MVKKNERFTRLLRECKEEMKSLNIPFNYDIDIMLENQLKSSMGITHRKRIGYATSGKQYIFTISLSDRMNFATNKAIKDTILHELIHTIDGCFNHGENFKRYANMLNNKYGYEISRTGSMREACSEENFKKYEEQKNVTMKYTIKCNSCGNVFHQARRTKFITNPKGFRCGICKQENFTITQNY